MDVEKRTDDTIAAIATAPGGAARGIVRLSGTDAVRVALQCFESSGGDKVLSNNKSSKVLKGRCLGEGLRHLLPCDLYLWPTSRSYTREPIAELHTIGSPPLLEAVLEAVCNAGARLAQPGEFTMRAFLAGRIDLTQAEAVLGVIDAHDPDRLRAALTQLAGGLAGPLHDLRNRLLDLLSHIEAGLDFVEEEIQFIATSELIEQIGHAIEEVAAIQKQMEARAEAGEFVRAVLIGEPNAGKSSLFNALHQQEGAIVSPVAGTTRDYLTARLEIGGASIELIDTAGIEPANAIAEPLTRAAQEATASQHEQSSIEVVCLDASRPATRWEQIQLRRPAGERRIYVWTKCDTCHPETLAAGAVATSATTGQGIDTLRDHIGELAMGDAKGAAVISSTAIRCRESLRGAVASLKEAREIAAKEAGEELVAAELRLALEALGHVTGAVYTDDVLDRIFSRFCIGK